MTEAITGRLSGSNSVGRASIGLQAGGSSTDFVLLLMNEKVVSRVLKVKTKMGSSIESCRQKSTFGLRKAGDPTSNLGFCFSPLPQLQINNIMVGRLLWISTRPPVQSCQPAVSRHQAGQHRQ
jgi:hypothetical protein